MTLRDIKEILKAEVIVDSTGLKTEIKIGCACDLMSDCLSFARPDSILLTGLTNPQVIHTADVADIKAVCFVRGKKPHKDTIRLAKEKQITLLRTNFFLFKSCGLLYKEGLVCCGEG
jgi:predicted transcriptional regulator